MIAPQSHSGFYRTTIAKCFLAITVTCSFVLSMPFARYRSFFTYKLDDIFKKHEIWRLIPSKIAFLDTKDLIIGGLLLYYFRIFERRFGPKKYMSYVICTGTMATVLELSSALLLRNFGFEINTLPSGPYSNIFPFFVPYFTEIPRVAFTHILGVPVTGKSFPYIMGLQIASSSIESFLVCSCGLLSGLLYHWNLCRVQQWFLFPGGLVRLLGGTLGRYLQSPPPANLNHPIGATLEIQRQEYMERLEQQMIESQMATSRTRAALPNTAAAAAGRGFAANWLTNGFGNNRQANGGISDDNIRHLVDMGFTQTRVLNALRMSNNDMNLAMNILLQEAATPPTPS